MVRAVAVRLRHRTPSTLFAAPPQADERHRRCATASRDVCNLEKSLLKVVQYIGLDFMAITDAGFLARFSIEGVTQNKLFDRGRRDRPVRHETAFARYENWAIGGIVGHAAVRAPDQG